MKLKALIDKVSWDQLKDVIIDKYGPDFINKYEDVFNELKNIKIKKSNNMRIVLHKFKYEKKTFAHVFGKDGTTIGEADPNFRDSEIANEEQTYSLAFTPWGKWLDMEIDSKDMKKFSEYEILSFCLWEMTYHGFSQKNVKKELAKLVCAAKKVFKDKKG